MCHRECFKRAVIYRIRAKEKTITTTVVEILRMNSQMALHTIAKTQWHPLISGSVLFECVCGKCFKGCLYQDVVSFIFVRASKRRGEQSHADWVRCAYFLCVCLMHWNHFYHRMHVSTQYQTEYKHSDY